MTFPFPWPYVIVLFDPPRAAAPVACLTNMEAVQQTLNSYQERGYRVEEAVSWPSKTPQPRTWLVKSVPNTQSEEA